MASDSMIQRQNVYGMESGQNVGVTPATGSVRLPGSGNAGQRVAAIGKEIADSLGQVVTGFVEMEDFSAKQEGQLEIKNTINLAKQELERRNMLPDGDEESFYDDYGTVRENALREFVQGYTKDLAKVATRGVLPKTKELLYYAAKNAEVDLTNAVMGAGFKKQQQKAANNLRATLEYAKESGEYHLGVDALDDAVANNLISGEEYRLNYFELDKHRVERNLTEQLMTDPMGIVDDYYDGVYKGILSPAEEQKYLRAARAKLKEQEDMRISAMMTPGTKAYADFQKNRDIYGEIGKLKGSGLYTNQELNLRAKQLRGDKDAGEFIEMAAQNEAMAYNPAEDMDAQKAKWQAKWGAFGLSMEKLLSYWDRAEKHRAKLHTDTIDLRFITNNADSEHSLITTDKLKNLQADLDGDWERLADKRGVAVNVKNKKARKAALELSLKKEYEEDTKALIVDKFNTWRRTEGKEANALEQYNKSCEIVKELTGIDIGKADSVVAIPGAEDREHIRYKQDAFKSGYDPQGARHKAYWKTRAEEGNKEALLYDPGKTYKDSTIEFNDDPSYEEGVILPPEWVGSDKDWDSLAVNITDEDGKVWELPVVGVSDKASNMQVTRAAARKAALDTNEPMTGTVQVLGGLQAEADLNDRMLAARKTGRTTHERIANLMYVNEARRDKNGNLKVHFLDKSDGGGTWEVAGFNTKYHPEVAKELRKLIDKGEYDKAERLVKRKYIEVTQPARQLMAKAGIKSEGVETVLRDIAFNMGETGLKRTLIRAVGLKGKEEDITDDMIAEAMAGYDESKAKERELVYMLHKARADRYRGIVRKNPRKKKYARGWANRLNRVTSAALAAIDN